MELKHAPMCLRRDVDDLAALWEAMELGVAEFTFTSLYGTGGAACVDGSCAEDHVDGSDSTGRPTEMSR